MGRLPVSALNSNAGPDDRLAGAALAGASALSILAMAHHPTGTGHSPLAEIVHGAMIVFVLASFAGYSRLAARRGLQRFVIWAALVTYGAGAMANVLAATINGFVVGAVVADGASDDILRLCWALNQALAYGAVYATSIAFLLWGADLMRDGGARRIIGVIGVAAGTAPAALLMTDTLEMNVAGAFVVYALQAAFGVLVGADLLRTGARTSQGGP
jgi:hypothetical protein